MKRLWSILILATLHSVYADDAARKQWEIKITLLTNGMTRAQVEEIFPIYPGAQRTLGSGGGYGFTYSIDSETTISLSYDYSGHQTDPSGKTIDAYNPSNRLLGVFGLGANIVKPMKSIELKTIEQNENPIEQGGPGYPPQGVGSPDPWRCAHL